MQLLVGTCYVLMIRVDQGFQLCLMQVRSVVLHIPGEALAQASNSAELASITTSWEKALSPGNMVRLCLLVV